MTVQLDEILATTLVDEVGIEKALKILDKATDLYRERHPGARMNPDYVRMSGMAKEYAAEKKGK